MVSEDSPADAQDNTQMVSAAGHDAPHDVVSSIQDEHTVVPTLPQTSSGPVSSPVRSIASRALRTRPSLNAPLPAAASSISSTMPIRSPGEKELASIRRKLAPEAVEARRIELLHEKETELRELVDQHDTAVREKFHLERYVTMMTGWDPELAKKDNAPVFLDYKRTHHNLLDLAPQDRYQSSRAGPSRPRASLPSRRTRHQAHEQEEMFAQPVPDVQPVEKQPKVLGKGKQRAREEVEDDADDAVGSQGVERSGRPKAPISHVEDPPLDTPVGGKKRGRPPAVPVEDPPPKRGPGRPPKSRPSDIPPSPATPAAVLEPEPDLSQRSPTPLPSLAHLPFPPVPVRPPHRRHGPNRMWYTDPVQRPPPSAKHHGDIAALLASYIHLEDTGPPPDLKSLEARAAREAYYQNRVTFLQTQGRMLRLLDENPDNPSSAKSANKAQVIQRQQDHQDHLLAHMRQVRHAMLDEAKNKPLFARRIARMITQYWEHLEGRDERERLEAERELKRKGKELVKALRKRWALAVKVVRARLVEAQKQEQDRLGKEHLQSMLQRSTGLLEAQQAGDFDEDSESSEAGTNEESAADASDLGEDGPDTSQQDASEDPDEVVFDDEVEDGENDDDAESSSGTGDDDADLTALLVSEKEVPSPAVATTDVSSAAQEVSTAVNGIPEAAPHESVQSLLHPRQLDLPRAPSNLTTLDSPDPLDLFAEISAVDSGPAAASANGAPNGDATSAPPPDAAEKPIIRSRRARGVKIPAVLASEVDPDANDVEFADNAADDLDDEDERMDAEMEDDDSGGADSEDDGLLADADLPIEELLKRYGYSMPNGHVEQAMTGDEAEAETDVVVTGAPNGDHVVADQSLLDENLDSSSPLLIEGKRQRRVRQVWTPEDHPQALKKVKAESATPESTPEPTSEEESEEEEEEEVEEVEADPNAPKTAVPFLLRGILRPYQHAGLDWLASLYANNMNGILADEMGLGKTIQTISLLGHLACDRGIWGQHLIIVPTSVILNWEMEFKKFLPGFKVLTYYGNQKERKEKRVGWLTEHAWQVCITSYQIVLADQHIFRRKNWTYMILDEAHNIKNFRSQRWQTLLGFKAQRRLLLTGTPLQNNLMELWSLLYFLMPHGIAEEATSVVGFANHKDFMEWFSNPMDKAVESGDVLDTEALATVSKLHTLLRPFILRRLKSEVETQLPGKFEHVVYCRLSKRQRFLYDEFMSRSSTREALTNGGYLGVMNTLMQLRKVCNHPDLFEVRPVRTSFAMNPVAADFGPTEILVRKRLLARMDELPQITSHETTSGWVAHSRRQLDASDRLPHAIEAKGRRQPAPPKLDTRTVEGWLKYTAWANEEASVRRWRSLRDINRRRCSTRPIYGSTLLSILTALPRPLLPLSSDRAKRDLIHDLTPPAAQMVSTLPERARLVEPLVERFAVIPPNTVARDISSLIMPPLPPLDDDFDTLHHAAVKLQIAFPDMSLLQYDCGKLQKLAEMLRDLKADGHRVLIFTQMTRVLDILETFLSYNGHRYLRLDGSTKIEDRQIVTERFNTDARIFCFIASSRSGGVGINLTGADTVFFYDSDWNPSMDRQCMDRAHRIGQTREVHIYRFVSSHTVEENMLKKANQKRLLDKVVIQEGDFTTEFFGKVDWRDTLYDVAGIEKDGVEDVEVEDEPEAEVVEQTAPRRGEERAFAKMVAEIEDEEDVQAARMALGEGEMDVGDFEAEAKKPTAKVARFEEELPTPVPEEGEEDDVGAVDEYMLKLVEWDWAYFISFRG